MSHHFGIRKHSAKALLQESQMPFSTVHPLLCPMSPRLVLQKLSCFWEEGMATLQELTQERDRIFILHSPFCHKDTYPSLGKSDLVYIARVLFVFSFWESVVAPVHPPPHTRASKLKLSRIKTEALRSDFRKLQVSFTPPNASISATHTTHFPTVTREHGYRHGYKGLGIWGCNSITSLSFF